LRARRVAAGIELTSRMQFDDSMAVHFERLLCEFRRQSPPPVEISPPSETRDIGSAGSLINSDADLPIARKAIRARLLGAPRSPSSGHLRRLSRISSEHETK
jgi:hypothetical protein